MFLLKNTECSLWLDRSQCNDCRWNVILLVFSHFASVCRVLQCLLSETVYMSKVLLWVLMYPCQILVMTTVRLTWLLTNCIYGVALNTWTWPVATHQHSHTAFAHNLSANTHIHTHRNPCVNKQTHTHTFTRLHPPYLFILKRKVSVHWCCQHLWGRGPECFP